MQCLLGSNIIALGETGEMHILPQLINVTFHNKYINHLGVNIIPLQWLVDYYRDINTMHMHNHPIHNMLPEMFCSVGIMDLCCLCFVHAVLS